MFVQAVGPIKVGHYHILEVIGKGSMGTVYLAQHGQTQAKAAIKIVTQEVADNPVLVRRFQREFEAARELEHTHLVRVVDFGQLHAVPYLVMEYVEGESLGQVLDRQGPLPIEFVVRIATQVAEALDFVHERGFIHRDVKPDNILLTPDGRAKLGDFGLVKDLASHQSLTRSGKTLGTPNFMAPEQFEDAKHVDRRCDVYSLAATLYIALTGEIPFRSRSQLGILRKKLQNDFPSPSQVLPGLSPQVDWAIRKALQADPGKRHASCQEFIEALTEASPAAAQRALSAGSPGAIRAIWKSLASCAKPEKRGRQR